MKVQGMNLETDADIMVWARNVGLAMGEVAKATGCRVGAYCTPEGYVLIEVGDYDYNMRSDGKEGYFCNTEGWSVQPAEIHFSGKARERKMP